MSKSRFHCGVRELAGNQPAVRPADRRELPVSMIVAKDIQTA
jgi:hypothetical protein